MYRAPFVGRVIFISVTWDMCEHFHCNSLGLLHVSRSLGWSCDDNLLYTASSQSKAEIICAHYNPLGLLHVSCSLGGSCFTYLLYTASSQYKAEFTCAHYNPLGLLHVSCSLGWSCYTYLLYTASSQSVVGTHSRN